MLYLVQISLLGFVELKPPSSDRQCPRVSACLYVTETNLVRLFFDGEKSVCQAESMDENLKA